VAQARAKTAERPLVRPAAEESTRRRILEAATREFLDKSYDGTSMGAIARRVGISPPALYWHFDSKSSLFYAFLDSVLTDFVTAVAAAVTVTDPRGRLRQFVRAHVVRQLSKAGTWGRLWGFDPLLETLPREERGRLVRLQRQHLDLLREILREGDARGVFAVEDATVSAFAIMTMCEYVISWWRPDGRLGPEETGDTYADLAERMVLAPEADRRTRERAQRRRR
jgi:AcrR family transcriptional regulator